MAEILCRKQNRITEQVPAIRLLPVVAGLWLSAVRTIRRWRRTARDRRDLLKLSDALLEDIGLTRADIAREANRPFWNPIDHIRLEERRGINRRRFSRLGD